MHRTRPRGAFEPPMNPPNDAPDPAALGVSPRDAYIMGRSNLWFLQAARAALAEAGLPAVCTASALPKAGIGK